MGCVSSKRIEATVDVYRPPPSSFALFDVNTIDEPWLKDGADQAETEDSEDDKPTPPHVQPILDKLKAIDDQNNPRTWDEVSKTLEDLKPKLNNSIPSTPDQKKSTKAPSTPPAHDTVRPKLPRKSFSFHTLEELETKTVTKPSELKRADSVTGFNRFKNNKNTINSGSESKLGQMQQTSDVPRSLKENIFILKDRAEREKEGKQPSVVRFDPLRDFPEMCPPGGGDGVVIYTTSLGGVRRTFEDCNKVRQLMETHQVVFDERDVALDGGFRGELKEMLGEAVGPLPRVFVKGRYIGGVDEVVGLNEVGKLSRVLNWARVERGVGRLGCEGCGGARFVPCLGCGGSCKVVVEGEKGRCGECNENGLVHCPLCI